jgi:hypothetical protein
MDKESGTQSSKTPTIRTRTPEMEAHLGIGYGLTLADAQTIVDAVDVEKGGNPQAYPYTEVNKARAFIAAYSATPKPVATRQMWQRPIHA